jgi:hypothetical protein
MSLQYGNTWGSLRRICCPLKPGPITISGLVVVAASADERTTRLNSRSILAGRALPDLHTLARAEAALRVRLWPDGPA